MRLSQLLSALPKVRVGPSRHGRGVFTTERIPPGTWTCLYPGVYTPGMPPFGEEYLATEWPPSEVPPQQNEYILNIDGYLDGLTAPEKVEAPAVGHLVNHSSQSANVEIISFVWPFENNINTMRLPDNAPWYYYQGNVVRFTEENTSTFVRGAALSTLCWIDCDEELLLNYKLKHPLPAWARLWYEV